MSTLQQRLSKLSPQKRALLIKKLKQQSAPKTQLNIPVLDRSITGHQLSNAQQRMWFFQKMDEANTTYNMSSALSVTGQLNIDALNTSLSQLIERHESLRMVFVEQDGKPMQAINPAKPYWVTQTDLSALDDLAKDAEVKRRIDALASYQFDLIKGPLLDIQLLVLGDKAGIERYVLLANMHHIVSDGWSMTILIRELSALYQANISGNDNPLAPLPTQYVDFCAWQKDWLSDDVVQKQLSYWRKKFDGAPNLFAVPGDYPRPAIKGHQGRTHFFNLPQALVDKVNRFSQTNGMTQYMVLLAVFKVLLAKYSGQQDLVIGTPTANRNREVLENIIGFFANTIAIRTELSRSDSFTTTLKKIKSNVLSAHKNQDVPFDQVVDDLKPKRSLSYSPLFQVMFVLQNVGSDSLALGDLAIENIPVERVSTDFDIILELCPDSSGMHGILNYRTDLYRQSTIDSFVDHYHYLLETLISQPQCLLSDVQLPKAQTQWAALQLEHQPNKVDKNWLADIADNQVTYDLIERKQNSKAELVNNSLKMAGFLATVAKPGQTIGVLLANPEQMVITTLAAWQAGLVVTPIHDAKCAAGIELQLIQTKASILICDSGIAWQLPDVQSLTYDKEQYAQFDCQICALEPTNTALKISAPDQVIQWQHKDILAAVNSLHIAASDRIIVAKRTGASEFIIDALWALTTTCPATLVAPHKLAELEEEIGSTCALLLSSQCLGKVVPGKQNRMIYLSASQPDPAVIAPIVAAGTEVIWQLTNQYFAKVLMSATVQLTQHQEVQYRVLSCAADLRLLDEHLNPIPYCVDGHFYLHTDQVLPTSGQFKQSMVASGINGRLTVDGEIRISFEPRTLWNNGFVYDAKQLAQTVIDNSSVTDMVSRQFFLDGTNYIISFVVCKQFDLVNQLASLMADKIHWSVMPDVWVAVKQVPLLNSGEVDWAQLTNSPTLTATMLGEIDNRLLASTSVREAVTLVLEQQAKQGRSHLSDLVPGWQRAVSEQQIEQRNINQDIDDSSEKAMSLLTGKDKIIAKYSQLSELLYGAAEQGDHGIHYIDANGKAVSKSYQDILQSAKQHANGMQAKGLKSGDKVLFLTSSNELLVPVLWASILLGAVPVPLTPIKSFATENMERSKLLNACQLLKPHMMIIDHQDKDAVNKLMAEQGLTVAHISAAPELDSGNSDFEPHQCQGEDIALMMLTSGSTGTPKAVMQTHNSLISQISANCAHFDFDHREVSLNWMPLDHVAGIVMFHMRDIYSGAQQVLVTTDFVLADPLQWIQLMSQYRASLSWAPNFAYALVNERKAQFEDYDWDLSAVRCIFNGAESIVRKTSEDFLLNLAEFGMKNTIMIHGWGMSETSSGILFTQFDASIVSDYVEIGTPIPGTAVRVADENDKVLSQGKIGRLQVLAACVTKGYYQNNQATEESFTEDGWFITGDLAMVINDQMIMTGREKDVIIINGKNFYGHEIEQVVDDTRLVKTSFTAACGIREQGAQTDRVVIFFVLNDIDGQNEATGEEKEALITAAIDTIRNELINKINISPAYLIPVTGEDIPKTSIGKIMRVQLANDFLAGRFDGLIKNQDLLLANSNTLENWFSVPHWTRCDLHCDQLALNAATGAHDLLIFSRGEQDNVLLNALAQDASIGEIHVVVQKHATGNVFSGYCLNGVYCGSLSETMMAVNETAAKVRKVLYLWADIDSQESLIVAKDFAVANLLACFKAVTQLGESPLTLLVATTAEQLNPQSIGHSSLIGIFTGLLKTAQLEMPWINACLIELAEECPVNQQFIHEEVVYGGDATLIRYYHEQRQIRRLQPCQLTDPGGLPKKIRHHGVYLITGGLGGIGLFIASRLLQHYTPRLMLIGRSTLNDKTSAKAVALAKLIKDHGADRVCYHSVDILDKVKLEAAVTSVESDWGKPLDGIFHLAGESGLPKQGEVEDCTLIGQSLEAFNEVLAPKVEGLTNVGDLLLSRKDSLFVGFSSVNALFGGATFGAYSAANAYLDRYCENLAAKGNVQCYGINWSMWDDVGMSEGFNQSATIAMGYQLVTLDKGWASLLVLLNQPAGRYVVGVDSENVNMLHQYNHQDECRQKVVSFVVGDLPAANQSWQTRDIMGSMVQSEVVLLDEIPKTTAGEPDRKKLTALGALAMSSGDFAQPGNDVEQILLDIWCSLLSQDIISINDNFFEVGGDSILSTQVIAKAKQQKITISPQQMFEFQTIAELAEVVSIEEQSSVEQEKLTGQVELSPVQSWFIELDFNHVNHWNQSVLLSFNIGQLNQAVLQVAISALVHHHDALRLRLDQHQGVCSQQYVEDETVGLSWFDFSQHNATEAQSNMVAEAEKQQASLHLFDGPIIQVAGFILPNQQQRILLAVHHWVTDGITWRILMEDLTDFYQQALGGATVDSINYPYKSSSYRSWTALCHEQVNNGLFDADEPYWRSVLEDTFKLPFEAGDNLKSTEIIHEVDLDAGLTQDLISNVLTHLNVDINDVLLSVLNLTFNEWSEQPRLLLALEGHGRDGNNETLDISRTCGWFTSIYPVELVMPQSGSDIWQTLKQTKKVLRAVPNKGLSFGLLGQLKSDGQFKTFCQQAQKPEISFNYLGQFDNAMGEQESLMSIAKEHPGAMQNKQEKRVHKVDVVCFIIEGKLKIGWSYATDVIATSVIENMAQRYLALLQQTIKLAMNKPDPVLIQADFPLLKCDENEFEQILLESSEIVAKDNIETIYPVASIQHGLLYHSMLAPGEGVYVSQLMNQLSGQLDVDSFRQAWQMTIERHEVYRSGFIRLAQGTPCTVVAKNIELNWTYNDWSAQDQATVERNYNELLQADRIKGFGLEDAPLLRIYLIKLGEQLHRFVVSEHHAISDGWSRTIVLTEVLTHYEALAANQHPKLPKAAPFSKYLLWQQEQHSEKALAYWRNELEGVLSATSFSVDKTKGTDQAFVPMSFERHVDKVSTDTIKRFSRENAITLNILVQSAWALLLSRYSNESNVVFGATVSGRPLDMQGSSSIVGPFINSLPVHIKVDQNTAVGELLKQMHSKQSGRTPYEFVALSEIQNCCEVPAGQPLFESLVVFENYPILDSSETEGELKVEWSTAQDQTELPMTILIDPADEMGMLVYFDGARFEPSVIEQMMVHLEMIMMSFAQGVDRKLFEQRMLTGQENHKVYNVWNQPNVVFGTEDKRIHDLFTEQVAKTPDGIAVIYDGGQLSYRQTYNRSVTLANDLVLKGSKPNKLIGVVLEKGWEHVVATYAIMYSGGAYLPIDPLWPEERRDHLLKYGEVDVVLTSSKLFEAFNWPSNVTRICMDSYAQDDLDTLLPVPENKQQVSDLAYVIFTSGSTGNPKGVMIDHRGAVNTLVDINQTYNVDHTDRILAVSSLTFDLSVYDIFGLLAIGGAVVIPNDEQAKDPAAWSTLVAQHQVTLWDTVPALMLLFVEYQERQNIICGKTIRVTMMSGDWIPIGLPNRIKKQFPSSKVISMGGATEASIWSIRFPIEQLHPDWISIPYGKAMTNQSFFVYSDNFEPCPVGVQGNMYIGGVGLAKGYWRDEIKSAQSFIKHPVSGDNLYFTGDLGRYKADGNIEFLGRSDFQIKLNGYRIELGEIQTALVKHPEVEEAVIVVREDEPGEKRLVAYYIAIDETEPLQTDELRVFLRKLIPEYMVPWQYMVMASFPLSGNGKVDLKQLPAPAKASTVTTHVQLNEVEAILVSIWSDVLDNNNIAIDDNFFEMGGHSLLTAQVIARVRDAFSIDLPIRTLFTAPTIRDLSEQIDLVVHSEQVPYPLVEKAADDDLSLSSAQNRLWFLNMLEGDSATYNITTALKLTGNINQKNLSSALELIVSRHEVLRTTFTHQAGVPSQQIAANHQVILECENVAEAALQTMIDREARFAFNLEAGPLYRFAFSRQNDKLHTLIVTIHHIISDGWSLAMFMQELTEIYNALERNEKPNLPVLNFHYRDYAKWERAVQEQQILNNQTQYWREQLTGLSPLLMLPTDKERPPVQTYGGANEAFMIDGVLFAQIQSYCAKQSITLYMHLLSTLNIVLHLESGQDDIAVGTTVANRTLAEFESIMGFFANQVVMRTNLSGNPEFKQVTDQVRKVSLDAYSYQVVPFEQLVEALLPDRGLAYTPLFQVKLVLQNVPLQASTVGDCQVECIPLDPGTSKFDLQFTMDETPQGLSGILTYNTDIFESPSACRIIAKWLKVMAITAEQSDITITGIKAKLAASVDTSGANVAAKSLGKLKSRRTRGTKKSGKDNG